MEVARLGLCRVCGFVQGSESHSKCFLTAMVHDRARFFDEAEAPAEEEGQGRGCQEVRPLRDELRAFAEVGGTFLDEVTSRRWRSDGDYYGTRAK